jgi:hypothetical protein
MPLWADKLLVGVGQARAQLAKLLAQDLCRLGLPTARTKVPRGTSFAPFPTPALVILKRHFHIATPTPRAPRIFEPCRTRQADALTAFGWTKRATFFPSEPLRGFLASQEMERRSAAAPPAHSKHPMTAKSPMLTPLRISWVSMRLHHMVACSSSSWTTKTRPGSTDLRGAATSRSKELCWPNIWKKCGLTALLAFFDKQQQHT